MSYTNPQQIVDTQSAQHLANLQQTITSTFAGVAASYSERKRKEQLELKERAEKNDKIIKANQDEEDNIAYNYEKYKIDNPELNLPDVLPGVIDEYSNIKNALDLGTISDPKEQARLRNKLLKIKTLPDQLKSSMTALSEMMLTYKESRNNAGKQGGLDTKLTDPNFLEALNVFFNNTSGKRDVSIEFDENGNLNTDFIIKKTGKDVEGTDETVKIPYRFFRDYLADKTNAPIVVIPDLTKNQENIDKRILVKDTNDKSIVPLGLLKTITQKRGDFVEELKVVDPDKIKSQYGQVLKGDIEGMDDISFMSYYNNILNPSDPITKTEAKDKNIMLQKRQEGADLYVNNYIQRYRKYEEVIKKTRIITSEGSEDFSQEILELTSNPVLAIGDTSGEVIVNGDVVTLVGDEKNKTVTYDLNKKQDRDRYVNLVKKNNNLFNSNSKEANKRFSKFRKQLESIYKSPFADKKGPTKTSYNISTDGTISGIDLLASQLE